MLSKKRQAAKRNGPRQNHNSHSITTQNPVNLSHSFYIAKKALGISPQNQLAKQKFTATPSPESLDFPDKVIKISPIDHNVRKTKSFFASQQPYRFRILTQTFEPS